MSAATPCGWLRGFTNAQEHLQRIFCVCTPGLALPRPTCARCKHCKVDCSVLSLYKYFIFFYPWGISLQGFSAFCAVRGEGGDNFLLDSCSLSCFPLQMCVEITPLQLSRERFPVSAPQALPKNLSFLDGSSSTGCRGETLDCLERIHPGDFICPSHKGRAQTQPGAAGLAGLAQAGCGGTGIGTPGCPQAGLEPVPNPGAQSPTSHLALRLLLVILIKSSNKTSANSTFLVPFKGSSQTLG